eukprot:jgi/Orpsp1_1/1179648/evm.model.c7180000070192.2
MLDAEKIKKNLPRLEDYKKNVLEWTDDLKEYLLLYDITEPRKVFTWVLAAVEDNVKDVIRALATKRNDEERYPKFNEIQKAVETYLEITEGDKWAVLRNLVVAEGESLKQFNHRYKKLYHNLSREYQKLITVKEYKESISSRIFPCSQVSIAKVNSLQEAYEIAELAETTEREIQERNEASQPKSRRNFRSTALVTQGMNFLASHPVYRNFRNESGAYYQPYYEDYKDEPNLIGNSRKYNSQSYQRNQSRNQQLNRNFTFNGKPTDNREINTNKNVPRRVTLATNDQEVKDASSKRLSSIRCFRCNQLGHKSPECPYSFKDLAEMEEKGLLN